MVFVVAKTVGVGLVDMGLMGASTMIDAIFRIIVIVSLVLIVLCF